MTSPQPAEVLCEILFEREALESHEDEVEAISVIAGLMTDDVRPMTDLPSYTAADVIDFNVTAALEYGDGPDSITVQGAAQESLENYLSERRRFGAAVPLTGIIAALHVSGVERVELVEPASDIRLEPAQVPQVGIITLTEAQDV